MKLDVDVEYYEYAGHVTDIPISITINNNLTLSVEDTYDHTKDTWAIEEFKNLINILESFRFLK